MLSETHERPENSRSAPGKVSLLTVSYAGDLARAELLVESLAETGSRLDHIVVVDTEDVGAFRKLKSGNVSIVATADVLSPDLEKVRRGIRRRHPEHWIRRAFRRPTGVHGWFLQQLVKLATCAQMYSCEAVLVVDSDLVAIDTIRLSDPWGPQARMLYTSTATDAEMASWVIDAMRFLDIPLQRTELLRYTFEPVLFSPTFVREMQEFIEARRGRPWLEAVLRANIMEYSLYGAFCDNCLREGAPRHAVPMPVRRISFEDQYVDFLDRGLHIDAAEGDDNPRFVVVHSRLGHDPGEYRHLFHEVWTQTARTFQ